MNRKKIILGLLTIWPFLNSIVAASAFLLPMETQKILAKNVLFMGSFGISMINAIILWNYYTDLARNAPYLTTPQKQYWVTMLYLFNIFSMPIYFYKYVWNEPPTELSSQSQSK